MAKETFLFRSSKLPHPPPVSLRSKVSRAVHASKISKGLHNCGDQPIVLNATATLSSKRPSHTTAFIQVAADQHALEFCKGFPDAACFLKGLVFANKHSSLSTVTSALGPEGRQVEVYQYAGTTVYRAMSGDIDGDASFPPTSPELAQIVLSHPVHFAGSSAKLQQPEPETVRVLACCVRTSLSASIASIAAFDCPGDLWTLCGVAQVPSGQRSEAAQHDDE